jgi:low affinity Fe/Cu permease
MRIIRHMAIALGSPFALLVVLLAVASGAFFGFSDDWWLWIDRAIYIASLWIIIVVQGAQNRDTEAMQRKLDELICAVDEADDRLQGIEKE